MIYVSDGVDITTDQVQTEHVTVTILISYLVGLKGCRVGIAGEVVN